MIMSPATIASRALWLDRQDNVPLQSQLVRQIKDQIKLGVLHAGDRMPSSRELSAHLRISRNTVVYSYDRLMSDGFLETRARFGVFVSSSIPAVRLKRETAPPAQAKVSRASATRSYVLKSPEPFRPCQPDIRLFPLLIWNRLRGRALRTMGLNLLQYQAGCAPGLPALRKVLATYVRDRRGVNCDWRQVIVTSGSQQALFLISQLLLDAESNVYLENPGYLGARNAFLSVGAKLSPGPIDAEGLVLPALTDNSFSLVYTTPSRQFPTGTCLSLARRLELVRFAEETDTWVIEDDYDSEFRYSAPPLQSLQGLDPAGKVIYVGTFSKTLFPSLRLGYVVLPESLVDRFAAIKALADDLSPLIDQATLSLFLESGAFRTHVRRCRRAYSERQTLFLQQVKRLGLPLRFEATDGGMNLTGYLPEGSDDQAWSERCREGGLDVPALSSFSIGPCSPGLVFGFTAFDPARITSALDVLQSIFAADAARTILRSRSR